MQEKLTVERPSEKRDRVMVITSFSDSSLRDIRYVRKLKHPSLSLFSAISALISSMVSLMNFRDTLTCNYIG